MDTKDLTEQARQQAQETAQNVKETAQQWTEKAKSRARDVGASADRYARENTWTTVSLVAVVAGLIGFLLGRRQS